MKFHPIRKQITIGGYCDEEKWPEIHEKLVDYMIRLENSIKPYIRKLKFSNYLLKCKMPFHIFDHLLSIFLIFKP
jgi:hypothetical protein